MKQEEMILKAIMQLNVVNDTLDCMQGLKAYKQEFKQEVNQIQKMLGRRLDMILRHSDDEEAKDYTLIVEESIKWWNENLTFEL